MRKMRTAWVLLVASGCGSGPGLAPAEFELAVAGASFPALVKHDGSLLATWMADSGSSATLQLARREANGWGEPAVAVGGRAFMVNWADFPGLWSAGGTLMVHWLETVPGSPHSYHAYFATSADAGVSWSPARRLHEDTSATEHGFVSAGALGENFLAAWLDGQATAIGAPMQLRFATLSSDAAVEGLVDGMVCDCCQTAMTVTDGATLLAYRDRTEGEIRDIFVRRFADGVWSDAVPVGSDHWHFAACPVNGPAIAASGDSVAVVWYAAPSEPAVQYAISLDGGSSFTGSAVTSEARAVGRVDVSTVPGGFALTWIEHRGDSAAIRMRRVEWSGGARAAVDVGFVSGARSSGFPRTEYHDGSIFVAWTDDLADGGVRIRRIEVTE